ncbi:MAG: hypothetical protein QF464_16040 [Myxococcota bacterium]|nr:hypothetical protein [Myxococcota bacterium]
MTDAEVEGVPFREGYLEDVSVLSGLPIEEVTELAEVFSREVSDNAHAYGWDFGGRIVAPAVVDPYLRMMPVARKIMDRAGVFMNTDERNRLLDGILYKYNYGKTYNCFREGAREVLESMKGTATYVVTNSHTIPVKEKLRSLGLESDGTCTLDWLVDRVHGSAKKYYLDDDFDLVPESMTLEGLPRPVLLRRKKYHTVLSQLLEAEGLSWSELVVVGDIFELDLCLPLAMGARVGLLANPFTPSYEANFLQGHPRGAVLTAVAQIPGFAFGT